MDYSSLKVTELKDEFKKRGLPTTKLSKKQDYIDRLLEDDAEKQQDVEVQPESVPATDGDAATVTEEPPADIGPVEMEEAGGSIPTEAQQNGHKADGVDRTEDVAPMTAPSATVEEDNKRKRRSVTPDVDVSTAAKKMKTTADASAHSPEDDSIQLEADAPVVAQSVKEDINMDDAVEPTTSDAMDEEVQLDTSLSAPLHAPTSSLYISNFVRPIDVARLKSHLTSLALDSASSGPDEVLTTFHIDSLRTHAFASFATNAQATRVRNGLHASVYPPEPQRKALNVDFIPSESVQAWIDTETRTAGPRPSQSRRWEVSYATDPSSGAVTASLVESGTQNTNTGASAPPSEPLAARTAQPLSSDRPSSTAATAAVAAAAAAAASIPQDTSPPPTLFPTQPLPDSFTKTTTQPMLFHRPVSPGLVSARLAALAEATDPNWSAREDHERFVSATGGGEGGGGGGAGAGLRRYTFQDGAELVDGGAEFGGGKVFGREKGFGGFAGGRGDGGSRYGGGRYGGGVGRGGGPPRRGYDSWSGAGGRGYNGGGGGGGGGYDGGGWGASRPRGPERDWVRDRY